MGFEDPDRPSSLERIIEACGGEAVDYPAKLKCCGFPIIQAREETAPASVPTDFVAPVSSGGFSWRRTDESLEQFQARIARENARPRP